MGEVGCLKDGHFQNLQAENYDFTSASATLSSIKWTSEHSAEPVITLENKNPDATGSTLKFVLDSDTPAPQDVLGNLDFVGDDSAGNTTNYATIVGKSSAVTSDSESGSLHFNVATTGSGALGVDVLKIEGGAAVASSVVTIGGKLKLGTTEIHATALPTEAVTATKVITASETGTRFVLNSATAFVSTLPAPVAGLEFWFYIGATPPTSGPHTVITNGSANIIEGQINSRVDAAGSVACVASADTISFINAKTVHGDMAHVWCDGTHWFLDGHCFVQDGMTTTQASA